MASFDIKKQLDPLLHYKCYACDAIPSETQIHRCLSTRAHILCESCTAAYSLRCRCGGELECIVNPLISLTTKYCPYKASGCDWVFSQANEIKAHTSECKFRPYECIGDTMNIWKCDWEGLHQDMAHHLEQKHKLQPLKYWHFGSVPCSATDIIILNLIDAFNKKFLFFYVSYAKSPVVHFVVQLLGRMCDAKKYVLELEVGDELKKMKFVETCRSDAIDLLRLMNDKQAMTIPKEYFKQYANSVGIVPFQFNLKREKTVIEENRMKFKYFNATMLANDGTRDASPNVGRVFVNSKSSAVVKGGGGDLGKSGAKAAAGRARANNNNNGRHVSNKKK